MVHRVEIKTLEKKIPGGSKPSEVPELGATLIEKSAWQSDKLMGVYFSDLWGACIAESFLTTGRNKRTAKKIILQAQEEQKKQKQLTETKKVGFTPLH